MGRIFKQFFWLALLLASAVSYAEPDHYFQAGVFYNNTGLSDSPKGGPFTMQMMPDGTVLVYDGKLMLRIDRKESWVQTLSPTTKSIVRLFPGPNHWLACETSDEKNNSAVIVYDTASKKVIADLPGLSLNNNDVFTGDGGHLFVSDQTGHNILALNTKTWKPAKSFSLAAGAALLPNPKGSLVAYWHRTQKDWVVEIYSSKTWQKISEFSAVDDPWNLLSIAFSPDDRFLAGPKPRIIDPDHGGWHPGGPMGIWDTSNGQLVAELPEVWHPVYTRVSWSPDSSKLAVAIPANHSNHAEYPQKVWVHVMDTNQTVSLNPLIANESYSRWLNWSPGGRLLTTGSAVFDVQDVRNPQLIPMMNGAYSYVVLPISDEELFTYNSGFLSVWQMLPKPN